MPALCTIGTIVTDGNKFDVFLLLAQGVLHLTWYQLLQLVQWDIVICGGRKGSI